MPEVMVGAAATHAIHATHRVPTHASSAHTVTPHAGGHCRCCCHRGCHWCGHGGHRCCNSRHRCGHGHHWCGHGGHRCCASRHRCGTHAHHGCAHTVTPHTHRLATHASSHVNGLPHRNMTPMVLMPMVMMIMMALHWLSAVVMPHHRERRPQLNRSKSKRVDLKVARSRLNKNRLSQ